jgi:hypothetical protein
MKKGSLAQAYRARHEEIADELEQEVRPPSARVRLAALPVYSGPQRAQVRVRSRRRIGVRVDTRARTRSSLSRTAVAASCRRF